MDFLTMTVINMPLVFVSLLLNLFFIYCLFTPSVSGKIKQPLKILLETMISSTVIYLLSYAGKCLTNFLNVNLIHGFVFFLMSLCVVMSSMTSSVWLSIFYYTQIVPAKRAFSVWIKKNIKFIIFSSLFFEKAWAFADVTLHVFGVLPLLLTNVSKEQFDSAKSARNISFKFSCMFTAYLVLSMCAMVASSTSVSVYLFRHIQRMQRNDQSNFSSTLHSQLRVAVTGILQSLLYLFCGLWITFSFIYRKGYDMTTESSVHYTLINMYMCGTTLNMWMGQSVFRQRSHDLMQALAQRSPRTSARAS